MKRSGLSSANVVLVSLFLMVCELALAQVNVTTYHNDNARTGQNIQETILTPTTVSVGSGGLIFGEVFQVPVDGQVYAQPLVLSGVSIGGGTHNVVYIATENDSVYAIDANTGSIYWQKSLLENGGKPIPDGDFNFNNNVDPKYGVTGTPVIDPGTGTLYVVATDEEPGPVAVHRVHALDVKTGTEKMNGPVEVGGSFEGFTFDPDDDFNRPALLLEDGHVIIAFGKATQDTADWGWIFSYNATNLSEEAAYSVDPSSPTFGGVWMGGDGIAADASSYLYFATANGTFGNGNYANSIIKLGLPTGKTFPFEDYFTPHDQNTMNNNDWDLGSGGVLVLPDLGSGTHPHLLVQSGKEGTIYLVDRTNLGGYCGSDTCKDAIVQELTGALVGGNSSNLKGVWGSPAYWNGHVYFGSANKDVATVADNMKAYSFNAGGSGLLSSTPTSETPEQFSWPAPNPSVSSNGTSTGIVWAIENNNSTGILHAYDATNLANELYNGDLYPQAQASATKFSVPTIANGKVYVGGGGQLTVYGLVTPPWVFSTGLPSNSCHFPPSYLSFSLNQLNNSSSLKWSTSLSLSSEGSELIGQLDWSWTLSDKNGQIMNEVNQQYGTLGLTMPREPVGTPTLAISGYFIAESGCYSTFQENISGTN